MSYSTAALVARAIQALARDPDARLSEVAIALGVDRGTLASALHGQGVNFGDVKSQRILGVALNLLLDGHHSVKEISALLGFPSTSAFSHYFHRHFGSYPVRVRAKSLQQIPLFFNTFDLTRNGAQTQYDRSGRDAAQNETGGQKYGAQGRQKNL